MITGTEPSATAAVDAVETVTHRQAIGEEIFSGMQQDAADGVAALRLLAAAAHKVDKLYPLHWDRVDGAAVIMPDRVPTFEEAFAELAQAIAACRAVGGPR